MTDQPDMQTPVAEGHLGINMPLPGEEFWGETVIASCFYSDDAPSFTVMTLSAVPPYYRVLLSWGRVVEELSRHRNIIEAAAEWKELTR